ncbi:copper chaperone PCu(A)C [Aquilutibacter rugosus]|uniref:copper chaperone PCu(A)C n=1 Tax=Aquilutibacter rugosus TaxID=3115820 RepID=UPI002F411AE5
MKIELIAKSLTMWSCMITVAVMAAPQTAQAGLPACVPKVSQAVVRVPPGKPRMMAGYFQLDNGCRNAIVLNTVRSSDFGEVSIHETVERENVARMRYVPALTVAPGDRVVFRPGGLHLMLMKPKTNLKIGSRIPIRMSGPGWSLQVMFDVKGMAG